jgi:hypothetical protein
MEPPAVANSRESLALSGGGPGSWHLRAGSTRGVRGRSLAGPPRPAARSKPPLSSASTVPSPLLLPSQFPLVAQPHLEEHQQHSCAKTERDQRDGEDFAGQPADEDRADRTSDNERRGRCKRHDARTGRHRCKVSLRRAAERITCARDDSAAPRGGCRIKPPRNAQHACGVPLSQGRSRRRPAATYAGRQSCRRFTGAHRLVPAHPVEDRVRGPHGSSVSWKLIAPRVRSPCRSETGTEWP